MKKVYFSALLCCITALAHGQWTLSNDLTFDPGDTFNHLVTVDTVHYHHNIWQIGTPHKVYFTSALSAPNVIVTDTTTPYPPNDTSAFILKMPADVPIGLVNAPAYYLSFYYQLKKDTNSIAMLEVSTDSGAHWYNTADTLPAGLTLSSADPSLQDTTPGWQSFNINIDLSYSVSHIGDTFLFRFTFISDSVTAGKDGWMIDNINLSYWVEGMVRQVQNNDLIALYPNPSTTGNIYIHATAPQPAGIFIYDMHGSEVYSLQQIPPDGPLYLPLPSGTYILRYSTDEAYAIRKLVITR